MPTPLDPQFWQSEEAAMYEEVLPLLLGALAAGLNEGADALPANLQPLINVNSFNQAALNYARQYQYTSIKGITNTTRNQVQAEIVDWIQSGQSLDALDGKLALIFGESRAAQIAATEVTRVFAEGNAQAWISTGFVNEVRFNTAEDDRVCPYCSPLDGLNFPVDDYGHKPPIHVNCRCFNTPVVNMDAVNAQIEAALGPG